MAFKMYGKSPMTKKICGKSAYKKVASTDDEKKKFEKMPSKKAKLIDQYSKVSGLQITSDGKEVRQSMTGPGGRTLVNKNTNREIDRDYRAKNQPKAVAPKDMPEGKKKRRTKRFEKRAMKS